MRDAAIRWLTIIAIALGAICSSWLIGFVAGWKPPGVLGYVAWALMPYAVLAVILLYVYMFRVNRSVQRLFAWAGIVIALGGPLLYFDAMFVHVDAQGALVLLMIPVIQTALGMVVAVVVILWQWRISRSVTKSVQQTVRKIRFNKMIKFILASSIIGATLFYILVSILQYQDRETIDTAKEVDFYISQYCKVNNRLPTSARLHERFPDLSTNIGWYYFTDDTTWLKLQYPVRWRNSDAIGTPKTSEFTATIYAYSIEYRCGHTK